MIKQATKNEWPVVEELVAQLWPGATPEETAVFFIKYEGDQPVGFAEMSRNIHFKKVLE